MYVCMYIYITNIIFTFFGPLQRWERQAVEFHSEVGRSWPFVRQHSLKCGVGNSSCDQPKNNWQQIGGNKENK